MSLSAGTHIDKYVVRRKLAEGGMAEIYLASARGPEGFDKAVVIKRILPKLAHDEAFVRMFVGEARVASRLSHANVVQIFDFAKHEDTYYIAMEYVRGQSLWAARRRARERMLPMSPLLVAHLGAEVARGLGYAHRLTDRGQPVRLVHRDVTPHNVLLGYEGEVKLADFGIAKAGDQLTQAGTLKGKFAYMSPEQARGESLDARSDIFSLGIVLWELLTGGRLFEADSDVGVLRAVQDSAIASPGRLNASVPATLDAIIMKALERRVDDRWSSAQELERALAQFVLEQVHTPEDTDVGAYLRKLFPTEAVTDEPRQDPSVSGAFLVSAPAVALATERPSVDADAFAPTAAFVGRTTVVTGAPERQLKTRSPSRKLWVVVGLLGALGVTGVWRYRHLLPFGEPASNLRAHAVRNVGIPPSAIAEPVAAAAQIDMPTAAVPSKGGNALTEPSAPSPEPTPELGILTVRAKPWAQLYIDGRRRADVQGSKTLRLPAGPHTIRLAHPRLNKQVRVVLEPGKEHVLQHVVNTER
ncbi:MAG: serine/threonine protein kinase [Myxococcaceae bacterium]